MICSQVQSEIAQKVARTTQRQNHIRGETRPLRTSRPPISIAFDLYSRARKLVVSNFERPPSYLQAVDLLNQAIARDPSFFCSIWNACRRPSGSLSVWLRPYSGAVGDGGSRHPGSMSASSRCRRNAPLTSGPIFMRCGDYDGALAEVEIADARTCLTIAGLFFTMGFDREATGTLGRVHTKLPAGN